MSKNLDWTDDINFRSVLTGDLKLIADRCGMNVLKSLLTEVPKIHVYISEKPLIEAQKLYIEKHYRQGNAKEIAARLGVSERFVYSTHRQILRERHRKQKQKSKSLFE